VKRSALLFVLSSLALLVRSEAQAEDEKNRYKFPCYAPESCYVTQLAHVNNALDFDVGGSGAIPAMAQSIVVMVDRDVTACTYPAAGLGIHAVLWDIDNRVTTYAHFSSASVASLDQLFQGDQVGVEGDTGYTYSTGPGGVIIPCARHLHWEPGSLPAYINDLAVSSLTASPTNYGPSNTNSVIGGYSPDPAGSMLRNYYINHGGWSSIGWTHMHCPGACTLNMTNNRVWGRMQDFRHHPDGLGGQFNTVHVANWNTGQAYLVDSVFWAAWAAGDQRYPPGRAIGMAVAERGGCPAGSTPICAQFQKFHLGYVWLDSVYAASHAAFCPDHDGDGRVDFDDFGIFFAPEYTSVPGAPNWDARVDHDGDAKVDFDDFEMFLDENLKFCRP
jgi:hypothetical protein